MNHQASYQSPKLRGCKSHRGSRCSASLEPAQEGQRLTRDVEHRHMLSTRGNARDSMPQRFNFSHYFKHSSINRKCRNFGVQGTSLFSFSLHLLFHFQQNSSLSFRLKFLCTKLFPSLTDIKGADTSGTSFPVLSDGRHLTFIKAF